ncbi:MAG: anti-sigma factor [Actinomycetes bacterium]
MSTSGTHDVHTLTGVYAADALSDEERRVFEEHLDECPSCRQEVDGLLATAARLGAAASSPAPPALRDRVLAEIATVRQVSPVVSRLDDRRTDRPWFRQPLGVAASLLLVVSIGLGALAVTERERADDAAQTAARVTAVVTDPNSGRVTLPTATGGVGTVIVADGQAVFRATGLPKLPSDRAYQLWRMDTSGAHSLGVLGRGGSVTHLVDHVSATDRLGLTVEPSGGSKRPTTKPVVVLPIPT